MPRGTRVRQVGGSGRVLQRRSHFLGLQATVDAWARREKMEGVDRAGRWRCVLVLGYEHQRREEMEWLVELVEPEDDDDGVLPRELLLFSSRALLLTGSL